MASPGPGAIFVVATPIGNLEDVTLRAIRVLREVDLIAAEDTRRARILLQHLGIEKRVVSYYDAIESRRAAELVRRAQEGESIALISDAGTPLVADPGYRLVAAAVEAGVAVVPIPGPSAPLAFLSCAGLPSGRFTFIGFLPARQSGRRREIAALAERAETLLFFETARRIGAMLADLHEILGPRPAAIGRELTKRFEEILRGDLGSLREQIAQREAQGALRGELVVGVAGCGESAAAQPCAGGRGAVGGEAALDDALRGRLGAGESVSDAARAAAKDLGVARRVAYRRALELAEAIRGR